MSFDLVPGVPIGFETATEADRCAQCGIFKGHGKFCPTQLQTKQQRVAVVASLDWRSERTLEICQEAGIPDDEIRQGLQRSAHEQHLRETAARSYGDPTYGAWQEGATDKLRRDHPKR